MTRVGRVTVGALGIAAVGGHALYPALLWAATRRRERPAPPEPASWPPVTVVIPAYREAGIIIDKLKDVATNGYPGPLELVVVADGDPETADVATRAGARVISPSERLGKATALNHGVAAASHDLIVLTDANNRIAPDSIAALVRWFGDARVGAVAGEKVERDGGGEELYWRFESWLKQREAELGTTIALVGELAAVRRQAWQPIPPHVGTDDVWIAMDLSARGWRIAYEPAARADDPPVDQLRDQWERRVRSVAGALHIFRRRWRELGPDGGVVAFELWGHRLWRYSVGPFSHAVLLAHAVRRRRSSRLAQLFLAGHAAGLVALTPAGRRARLPRPVTAAGEVLFLQGVAFGGWWRFARGDKSIVWSKPSR